MKYNGLEGNSPISSAGQTVSEAATNSPDMEDVNLDGAMSETEEYFQYRIQISPAMQVGSNHITDTRTNIINLDGGPTDVRWYQFKIPIDEFDDKVGNIPDFKSIRFIRVFLTGFEEPVVLRFARFELEGSDTVTAIANHISKQNISIYPNPNQGKFIVDVSYNEVISISAYNSLGQNVQPLSLNQTEGRIDINLGQPGFYFLRIETTSGLVTSKIIIR